MKYANFCDTGRNNINIGDYLQFVITDYLYSQMNVSEDEIVRLGFKELADYNGEDVIFPFCYSFIDFVKNGKLSISEKIKPIFFCVTLSTVDQFMNMDDFFTEDDNRHYLIKHSPIGCRDEITYNIFSKYGIPAYINGCMTAAFPHKTDELGNQVLLVDAPQALLPFIPKSLLETCEFSTQQYHFNDEDIANYPKIFDFVNHIYDSYKKNTRLAITSRLHVALPLAAYGIPVILAKDQIDGRFSFIEKYIPVYDKKIYDTIDWEPKVNDFEDVKSMLLKHALGRIQNIMDVEELELMEKNMTQFFQNRKIKTEYRNSHEVTHKNSDRFDEFAEKYWSKDTPVEYALWGASDNNLLFWKHHIESNYPNAKLVALYDSFKVGEQLGHNYQHPDRIGDQKHVFVIVCSVGAANVASKFFKNMNIDKSRYCITSDCFITESNVEEMRSYTK